MNRRRAFVVVAVLLALGAGCSLAVDTSDLANEGAGNLVGFPYEGADAGTVIANVADPVSSVADAKYIYIVSQNTHTIVARPVGGGGVVTIATLPAQGFGIAQTETAIYWAEDDGTIQRLVK